MDDFDRAAIHAFVERHCLTWAALARHAGVPYMTVYTMMVQHPESPPTQRVREALERALTLSPAKGALKHEGTVRRLWGREEREAIAVYLGVSPQRVSAIAKRLGLPPLRGGNDGVDERRTDGGLPSSAAAE